MKFNRIVICGTIATILAMSGATGLTAQSTGFKQGQWMEIQSSIMQNINRYYVDSLPVDAMYKSAIDEMLSKLDPYTVYIPESEHDDFEMMLSNSYGGIGAIIFKPELNCNVVINEPYEGSPAAMAGLQCGDEILEVDGQSVIGLDASHASAKMKGKPGTEVVFKVKKVRTSEVVDITITRQKIHVPSVPYYGMLDATTGYIYQTGFTEGVYEDVKSAMISLKKKGMKRLVLDLRGNGGGLLDEAVKIVSLFVPYGTPVVSSKGTDGESDYKTSLKPIDTQIPLLVMVDGGSASASEIVSGAIQDLDRGIIAGKRTYGKGLVQKVLPIAYNGQLKVTVAKYYTPSGRCVQARDYAHRADDGSVKTIPDSLTREFKTLKGRSVRDGGGITPDINIDLKPFNRVIYATVMSGMTSNWPIEFVRKHASIAPVDEFRLSDADYEDFAEWASGQKFDSRSEAETYFDLLEKEIKEDGLYEDAATALDSLKQIVKMDKKSAMYRYKEDLIPVLEEEIAVRYYYQAAGIKVRLRYDDQLKKALEQWQ